MIYLVLTLDNALLCTVEVHGNTLVKALQSTSSAFEAAAEVTKLTDGRRLVRDVAGAPLCYLIVAQASH